MSIVRRNRTCSTNSLREIFSKHMSKKLIKNNVRTPRGNFSAYLAGRMSELNVVIKCRRTIFFDCDMPKAEAIVSPVNEGSKTTNAP